MRRSVRIVVLGAVCALGGCGNGQEDQVRAKVRQLISAVSAQNYTTICREVLAPALVAQLQASGSSCPYVMQLAFGAGQTRTIKVDKVHISGKSAQASTVDTTKGQQPSVETIGLVQTAKGWRISSLNGPKISP